MSVTATQPPGLDAQAVAPVLAALAHAIDADGLAAHEPALVALGRAVAEDSPGAAAVLVDSTLPEPVRERAFALCALALRRRDRPDQRLLALLAGATNG